MLRLFQHLLPRGLAWRTTVDKTLRRFFVGLSGLPQDVRTFVDLTLLDVFPLTTRELSSWESQFALAPRAGAGSGARRLALAAAWSTQGRQSPDYLQRAIHAAGFTTVFVHEWWESGPPFVYRDPRDYTTQPLSGQYQCEGSGDPWQCFDSPPGAPLAPHCDETLVNDPGYIVNLDLTRRAPPSVPSDPNRWSWFLYFAGETFPELAPVEAARVTELRELVRRISPVQQWLVLLIDPLVPEPPEPLPEFDYAFSSSIDDSGPGAGVFRLNRGVEGGESSWQSESERLFIDTTDSHAVDHAAFFASIPSATLRIESTVGYDEAWLVLNVSAVEDMGGYTRLDVSYADASGDYPTTSNPFADGQPLRLIFTGG